MKKLNLEKLQEFDYAFKCGVSTNEYASKYMYLVTMLDEFLDYNVTSKYVAQSAGRAFGLLIAKLKNSDGLQFQ